jgi:hypothetical protein
LVAEQYVDEALLDMVEQYAREGSVDVEDVLMVAAGVVIPGSLPGGGKPFKRKPKTKAAAPKPKPDKPPAGPPGGGGPGKPPGNPPPDRSPDGGPKPDGGNPRKDIIKRPRPYENGEFKPGELDDHYAEHAAEWGGITKDAYLKRARSLLGSDVGGDTLGHTRANGDVVRFNKQTGEFAVGQADGIIRTLFRPLKGDVKKGATPLDYYFKDKQQNP